MVEPLVDTQDFVDAHDKFEDIKKTAKRDLSEAKQPGTIIFIGDNTATKEEIYKTLFGNDAKASVKDVTSTGSVDMSCKLYDTTIAMSASFFASKEASKDYENTLISLKNDPPVAIVVCGKSKEHFAEYLEVVKLATQLKFLAVSENEEGFDFDEVKDLAEKNDLQLITGDFEHKKDLKAMFRLRVGQLYFK